MFIQKKRVLYRCYVSVVVTGESPTNVEKIKVESDIVGDIEELASDSDGPCIYGEVHATRADVEANSDHLFECNHIYPYCLVE